MEGFKNMIPKKCKCIRDGKNTVVDAWELVPGGVDSLLSWRSGANGYSRHAGERIEGGQLFFDW